MGKFSESERFLKRFIHLIKRLPNTKTNLFVISGTTCLLFLEQTFKPLKKSFCTPFVKEIIHPKMKVAENLPGLRPLFVYYKHAIFHPYKMLID